MHTKVLYTLLLLLFTLSGRSQSPATVHYTAEDEQLFDQYLLGLLPKRTLPMGQLVVEAARLFLETPYVAATLEQEPEGVVVNFRGVDCTTLVENSLALAALVKDTSSPTFPQYLSTLRHLRYRGTAIGSDLDYTDRLHYMTDWIYENGLRGLVRDVTSEIGGIPLPLSLSFMSTHPDSYPALKASPQRVARMAEVEQAISSRTYYYIPQEEIEARASGIADGDVVCFVTSIKGLDVSHVGIACRVGEKLTFIHASSVAQKVIVNNASLADYTRIQKKNSGLIVVRPLPR